LWHTIAVEGGKAMNKKLFWLFTFLLLVAGTVVKAQLKKVPNIGYLRFIEFPVFDDAFRKACVNLVTWMDKTFGSSTGMPAGAWSASPSMLPSW